jgi:predicted transglutaminase-like cysteine proteinase
MRRPTLIEPSALVRIPSSDEDTALNIRHRNLPILSALAAFAAGLALGLPAHAVEMPLGEAVPPPVGFVEFCQREPADCPAGMQQAGRFGDDYWSLAFHRKSPGYRRYGVRLGPPASIRQPAVIPAPSSDLLGFTRLDSPRPGRKIEATPVVWTELDQVNRYVNARIIATRDRITHHVKDYWDLPLSRGDRRGDCEDYALEKRHELLQLGYPQEALSIALVRTRWGENHAVVVVETTAGPYVLDSFSPWITPWTALNYRWLARQSPDDPATWVEVVDQGRRARR